MMFTYTPGPWEIHPHQAQIVRAPNAGYFIADTFAHGRTAANAALISAAPDLLEALQDLLQQLDSSSATKINTSRALTAISKAWGD